MSHYQKQKAKKPLEEREVITVDGIPRRLQWVAKNRPEILLRQLSSRTESAYMSAFASIGLRKRQLVEMMWDHPEWEIDAGGYWNVLSERPVDYPTA